MIKISFCDDNSEVISQADSLMQMMEFDTTVDWEMFYTGTALSRHLEKTGEKYNIYILDIEMPQLNGIDIAKQVRESDRNALIIFLTDFKEYVYQVFEVLPFRFLQKPIELQTLEQTLHEAIRHILQAQTLFFFQIGYEQLQRPFGEITYFENTGRKVLLHTLTETIEFYGKIGEIWEQLDKQLFTRPHASFLVNMEYIRTIRQNEIIIAKNVSIPISKRFRNQVKQDHMVFVERRLGLL